MSLDQPSDQNAEQPWYHFKPGQSGCLNGRRGNAAERRAEAARIAAELLGGLPHRPTVFQRYLAETIASQIIEARRLRAQGKSTLENDRLVGRLTPLLMPDIPVGAPEDFTTKLAAVRAQMNGEAAE